MLEKELHIYIDKLLDLSGINIDMKTNPKLILEVLKFGITNFNKSILIYL